jgi:transposase
MKHNTQKKIAKQFSLFNPDAAGVDIGGAFHFVAVPADRDNNPVRQFNNFTSDLYQLADWLSTCGIKTVAMESTGVYWIPLYEILESRGFEVILVNARHVKNVPGRKSDVLDCQWIQQLHSYGLLRASFRPEQAICQLRSYMRQRESLIQYASHHIQHMQKALAQMNVQLANVVDEITGATGMKIIRALIAGERSPEKLASYRDGRCKQSEETIAKSLYGNFRDEHMFALRQAVELFDIYQTKIAECDLATEKVLSQITSDKQKNEKDTVELKKKKRKRRNNELHFDANNYLQQLTGVNLTTIDGLGPHSVLRIISEVGVDMSKWPTAKHFGSWLGLAPGTKISGGKKLSSKTKPSANRAATMLRIVASTLHHSDSALGAFLRRLKTRLGAPKAITATAYKIARLIYSMLKYGKEYVDAGQDYYEQQYKGRVIENIKKKAKSLGFQLLPIEQTAIEVP